MQCVLSVLLAQTGAVQGRSCAQPTGEFEKGSARSLRLLQLARWFCSTLLLSLVPYGPLASFQDASPKAARRSLRAPQTVHMSDAKAWFPRNVRF